MSSWLPYVVLTVLSWGTYIPTLHKGQAGLAGSGVHAFLMVGVAYVLVAIAVPGVMIARAGSWHVFTPSGVAFTVGAGVLGALGALGIVLALVNGGRPNVVPPLVFAGAPVVSRVRGDALQPAARKSVAAVLRGDPDGGGRRRPADGQPPALAARRSGRRRGGQLQPLVAQAVLNCATVGQAGVVGDDHQDRVLLAVQLEQE